MGRITKVIFGIIGAVIVGILASAAYADATARNRTVTAIGPKFKLTLSGTVYPGDLVGYSSGWKQALATVGTAIQARYVSLQSGVSGDVIEVASEALISGVSGATPGNPIYLAEGTSNGGTTETAPATTGDVNTILGYAVSATEIHVRPGMRADSLSA